MKRFTLLALGTIFGLNLAAQKANRIATPEQRSQVVTYEDRFQQTHYTAEPTLVTAQPYVQESNVLGTGKVSAVAPIQLGRASNIFSILRTEQNQVYADNDLGLVAFIHRHDVTIWGGGGGESGKLRFDLSVDAGATFTADIDVLNNTYTRPSRYPNLTGFNPNNETNPFSSFLAYSAPTLNSSPDWDGHVTGMVGVTSSAPAGATETYSLLSSQTYLQGGLTEALPGEFWTVERRYENSAFTGEIFVNKGTYNAANSDIDWVRFDTIVPNHFTGFDGNSRVVGPNISFSPDGMNGWIAWLGDLQGGTDTTYSPVVIQTTDGGATWGTPMEVDFNQDPIVAASLTAFWTQIDSITGDTIPASTGRGTTGFEFDLTVDANGNPHIFAVIGSSTTVDAPDPGYSIFSGIEKFAADIWSPDGGATWKVTYVAPVLAFRGDFGNTDPISMDNMPQISRTPSGDHVFYSWVDSDTSATTGSMNGIGFGVSDQLAPNLRIAGLRISDEYQTCYKRITDGDFIWEGRALFPTMAPEVLIDNGMVKLPIVMVEMITNEPLQSCNFWYVGNDATIDPVNDFGDPSQLDLAWDAVCTPVVSIENPMLEGFVLGQSFPNPTNGEAEIAFELPFATELSMDLVNMYGQQVAVLTSGEFAAGSHKVSVDTRDLAAGLYFYNLKVNGEVLTQKMMVTK